MGSIPAPTGKPELVALVTEEFGVYPRAYGETAAQSLGCITIMGLSPRLRGNLSLAV